MKPNSALWIHKDLHSQILEDIEKWFPLETGGVLMGYQGENGDVVITDLISSGHDAKHGHFSFEPDQGYQLQKIANIYWQTNGNITYIGDWHSHPKSYPNLSPLDQRTLAKVATTPESKNDHPVMLIYGAKPSKWKPNAVRYLSLTRLPWPLQSIKYEELAYLVYNERKGEHMRIKTGS